MRARVLIALATMAAVLALFIVAVAGPASAHVLKTVGPHHLLIGFGNERSFAGAQNSVFLLLTTAKTGAPIVDEGLGDTLKVEVRFGPERSSCRWCRPSIPTAAREPRAYTTPTSSQPPPGD
jgi:hypothetical protein